MSTFAKIFNFTTMKKFLNKAKVSSSEEVLHGKGKNIIPPPEPIPWWRLYLDKFNDPIVIVLLVIFCLSILVSAYEVIIVGKSWSVFIEPIGVFIALLLSTLIGFIFENKANNEFQILNRVKDSRLVKVFRKKTPNARPTLTEILRSDVVVGDLIRLDAGDEVPADGQVLYAENLTIDESIFTGELYAYKSAEKIESDSATYASDFLLRSTTVIEGFALYQVTAVGEDSEEGKGVLQEREGSDVETPLNRQLGQLGHMISVASFIIAGLIIIGRLIYYFHLSQTTPFSIVETIEYFVNSIMLAVTLIVVAVPEGLPMSVTISLALSMRKMLKTNNLVRKLHACETMGATTVICTDKTGTLTQNKMMVVETMLCGDDTLPFIIKNIAVNSTAELELQDDGSYKIIGNPTEGALLRWLVQQGYDYHKIREESEIINQMPFSAETKQMQTLITEEQTNLRFIKGAPEIIVDQCTAIAGGYSRELIEEKLAYCQSRAMRALAFALQKDEGDMVFLGFVGIADPIRSDVPEAIRICTKDAHVRVIIVTGDNAVTATEIGRQIGLIDSPNAFQQLDGPQFAAIKDEELLDTWLPHLKILSRAKPEDKSRLVMLLQKMGEVVAVTGDGTNDALALSKAQVGISMGSGTARAKEASDITILDNSFASINNAILWGRSLYKNIRRFIVFQMTINVCACLIVLVGAFMGVESPLTVTQMLWVNLIMDTFAAMALSSLPADRKVMKDKPRNPQSHIIDKRMMWQIAGVGVLFFGYLLGLWQLLWHTDTNTASELFQVANISTFFNGYLNLSHSKLALSGHDLGVFFSIFVLLQFWNLFNVKYFRTDRSLIQDIIDLFRKPKEVMATYSWGFISIVFAILVGQIFIVNYCGPVFNVAKLSTMDWLICVLLTSSIFIVPDIWRFIRNLLFNKLKKV